MGSLKGKNAIVTGSTSGIGEEIARALAGEGCNIVLNGFGDKQVIDALAKEITTKHNVKVMYNAADMGKPEQIVSLIQEAEKQFGSVDVLVNNAGIQFVAPIEDFPPEKWDAIIAINLSAAFHAMRAALPGMKKRRWGRIINIASAHGLVASAQKAAYVAAKHGLVGLTKVTAIEAANDGITCNAICPGWVFTPLVDKQIKDKAKQQGIPEEKAKQNLLAEKQPMHEFTQADQIGSLAVYLCSDAARTITGATLSIDGGWTAQ